MSAIDDMYNLIDDVRRIASEIWTGKLGEFDINEYARVATASLDVMGEAALLSFGSQCATDQQIEQVCGRLRGIECSLHQTLITKHS